MNAPGSASPSTTQNNDAAARPAQNIQRLFFGEFSAELDEERCHGLYRQHEPVGLSDMPRKVLFSLLQHRPRPVIAKALLEQLWPPGANASNLAKQVRTLRRAFGDEQAQRYIRTLNKEGYAFVMMVTSAPVEPRATPGSAAAIAKIEAVLDGLPVAASARSPGTSPLSLTEWRLAREKLLKDFRGSCLHELELLQEAIVECDHRIQLIVNHEGLELEGRFPREPLFVPPRMIPGASSATQGPDAQVAARAAELIRYSKTAPIVVNVGAYSTACIAVLRSLQRRYGLELRSDFDDLSGRQQILRLYHDDRPDFLLAPHAPFLLVGDYGALDYRRLTPVYGYAQSVLTAPGRAKSRRRRLLVYKGGSPDEQLMARAGIPDSAEPEVVTSLERLVTQVEHLEPGDMVIAWEPLASGLEAQRAFERHAEFRLWISLYCHERWQRGTLRALSTQFKQLFAAEWAFCRCNREWAIECLGVELKALAFFTAGSGLAPRF
jgi:DNA-binding winged helix-turn-helix (wHTH) protein